MGADIGEGEAVKLRVLDLFSGIGGFSLGLERTGATEFGLLATPTKAANQMAPLMQKHPSCAAWQGLLPTARSTDGDKGSRTAAGAMRELSRGKNVDLGMIARLWPTPTRRDYKGGRKPETLEASGRGATNSLNDALTVNGQHGQLNPQWVEWLMGFPTGWTDLKP